MRTSFSVNDMTIHRIVEQESGFTPMLDFLPTLSKETLAENLEWLAPGGYDGASGNVVLCFQSYVVRTPHHNILIDSCVGNHKPRPARPFWNMLNSDRFENGLAEAGLLPEFARGGFMRLLARLDAAAGREPERRVRAFWRRRDANKEHTQRIIDDDDARPLIAGLPQVVGQDRKTLADVGARPEQRPIDVLLVCQAEAGRGQGEKGRRAA